MASKKKKAASKPSVKFKDLKSKKNPKGGSFQYYSPIKSAVNENKTS
jgi:hypothetical protein